MNKCPLYPSNRRGDTQYCLASPLSLATPCSNTCLSGSHERWRWCTQRQREPLKETRSVWLPALLLPSQEEAVRRGPRPSWCPQTCQGSQGLSCCWGSSGGWGWGGVGSLGLRVHAELGGRQAKHPSSMSPANTLCGRELRYSDPECSRVLLPRAACAHRGRCGSPTCISLGPRGLSQVTLLRHRHSSALRT